MPIVSEIVFAEVPRGPRFRNRIGEKHDRLVVIGYAGKKSSEQYWYCRCSCGQITKVAGTSLSRFTRSCGCLQKEDVKKRRTKHGMSGSPIYRSWESLVRRCTDQNDRDWPRYGGRGIRVCSQWLGPAGFQNFQADMGARPVGTTIERVRNDEGYEPGNCIWGTPRQQARNRRSRRMLNFDDRTLCLDDWAAERGMSKGTLWHRLSSGWSVSRALTEPVRSYACQPKS